MQALERLLEVAHAAGLVLHRRDRDGGARSRRRSRRLRRTPAGATTARTPSVRSTTSPSPRVRSAAGRCGPAIRRTRRRRRNRRLPTWRTAPVERARADVESSAPSGSPSSLHAALGEQPPRLGARDAERLGDQRRQVDGPSPAAANAASSISSGSSRSTKTRSKCCLGARAPPPRRGSGATSARASARLASRGAERRPARLDRSSSAYHCAIASSGMLSVLPYISSGGVGDADVVAQRLRHLLHAVGAGQDRHGQDRLLGLAVGALDVAAEQQVERLVGAAELDVGARSPPSRSPACSG